MIYHKASLFIIIAAYRMWDYFNLKMAIYDSVLGVAKIMALQLLSRNNAKFGDPQSDRAEVTSRN